MKDIGGLIWVIIVVIGVISSIVKNAKKAAAQREAARPRMAPAPQPAPPPNVLQQMAIMPPVIAPSAPVSPPPVRRAKTQAPSAPVHIREETLVTAGTTSPVRGMFGSRESLVRAIVAAEVLGPPKSEQEQSIWSPRHSEPSI